MRSRFLLHTNYCLTPRVVSLIVVCYAVSTDCWRSFNKAQSHANLSHYQLSDLFKISWLLITAWAGSITWDRNNDVCGRSTIGLARPVCLTGRFDCIWIWHRLNRKRSLGVVIRPEHLLLFACAARAFFSTFFALAFSLAIISALLAFFLFFLDVFLQRFTKSIVLQFILVDVVVTMGSTICVSIESTQNL